MLAPLGVCKVGTVILVDSQAETTFEGPDVVLKEVRIFVEVYGLEGELAETLAAVGVGCALGGDTAAAKFGAGAVLVIHGCCYVVVIRIFVDILWISKCFRALVVYLVSWLERGLRYN